MLLQIWRQIWWLIIAPGIDAATTRLHSVHERIQLLVGDVGKRRQTLIDIGTDLKEVNLGLMEQRGVFESVDIAAESISLNENENGYQAIITDDFTD